MKYYSESGLEIKYGTDGCAGLDLPFYDPDNDQVIIPPRRSRLLKTGIHIEFPEGYFGLLDTRSSTSKLGLDLLCHTIDNDFRGNIRLAFLNTSDRIVAINRGDYLAQIVLMKYKHFPLERVDSLDDLSATDRGDKGFGSTTKKKEDNSGDTEGTE